MQRAGWRWWFITLPAFRSAPLATADPAELSGADGSHSAAAPTSRTGGPGVPAWLPRLLTGAAFVALTFLILLLAALAVRRLPHAWHSLTTGSARQPTAPAPLLSITRGDTVTLGVAEGGALRRTNAGTAVAALASPDGAQLLALQAICGRCPQAYVLTNAQGAVLRSLGTAPATTGGLEAAWSRDGRYVAFVEQGLDAARPSLYIFDTLTGNRRPVAATDRDSQTWPAWSPDGHWIAYLSGDNTVVTAANIDTGAVRILNDQLSGASNLAWSSGGLYIAALRDGAIWLVDADDGHGFQLTVADRVEQLGGWSPTGAALAAVVDDPVLGNKDGTSVVVLPADGAPPTVLSSGSLSSTPRWSPDSRSLAWIDTDAQTWSLWVAPAGGGAAVQTAHGLGSAALQGWR